MSPTHEPIRQLEPVNLLEPLDLSDAQAGIDWRPAPVPPPHSAPRPIPAARRYGRGRAPWRIVQLVLIGSGLLIVFFAIGAALPGLADLTLPASHRAAKAPPPSRQDATHQATAGKACDPKAWPSVDRECMNDTASASGDPSPPRVVTPDRNADGSPRTPPPPPSTADAAVATAPTVAPPAAPPNAPTASNANRAQPSQPADQNGGPRQGAEPTQKNAENRSAAARDRHGRHSSRREARQASRTERTDQQTAWQGDVTAPIPPGRVESPDAARGSPQTAEEPRADQYQYQSRRAERRGREGSPRSGRQRGFDDELTAGAEDGRRAPVRRGVPFFPFFGMGQSW